MAIVLTKTQRMKFISELRKIPFVKSAEEEGLFRNDPSITVKIVYSRFGIFKLWATYEFVIPETEKSDTFPFFRRFIPEYEIYIRRRFLFDTSILVALLSIVAIFVLLFLSIIPMFALLFAIPLLVIAILLTMLVRILYGHDLRSTVKSALVAASENRT